MTVLAVTAGSAVAADAVGSVRQIQGEGFGTLEGRRTPLSAEAAIYLDEAIETGPDARLAIGLADGTTLTLGEHASLTVDRFVFEPAGASSLHAAVAGAFRFVSGKLGPGATREANVATPVAVVGVRGTDFWGGPIDGQNGFVLLDGTIDVTINGATVTVDNAGTGVTYGPGAAAPGLVYVWSNDQVARAIATVTFH